MLLATEFFLRSVLLRDDCRVFCFSNSLVTSNYGVVMCGRKQIDFKAYTRFRTFPG